MKIKSAEFVISNTDIKLCPNPIIPEYAFIGRSNVGKSSLINMLCGKKKLAKTSGKPGKTQLINHFIINEDWYIVDLPGYGYAQVSKSQRAKWEKFIRKYLMNRENLMNVFVLVDVRIPAQKIDLEFMEYLGEKGVPFSIVFTKSDGVSNTKLDKNRAAYKKEMLKSWEEMPPTFTTSSSSGIGGDELLNYIDEINPTFDPELI